MIRPPCEITDQLAVGTQNCFSALFYTPYTNIKTSDQNAPLPDKKIQKISGEGGRPPPRTPSLLGRDIPSPDFPTGEGIPPPHWPLLRPQPLGAFRARRSRSFSFTTRTLDVVQWINERRPYLLCLVTFNQFTTFTFKFNVQKWRAIKFSQSSKKVCK